MRFFEDGRVAISNNRVENFARPFALGRKNWLFADTVAGLRPAPLLLHRRFYSIAVGGLREVQAVLVLAETPSPELEAMADRMSAQIHELIPSRS